MNVCWRTVLYSHTVAHAAMRLAIWACLVIFPRNPDTNKLLPGRCRNGGWIAWVQSDGRHVYLVKKHPLVTKASPTTKRIKNEKRLAIVRREVRYQPCNKNQNTTAWLKSQFPPGSINGDDSDGESSL